MLASLEHGGSQWAAKVWTKGIMFFCIMSLLLCGSGVALAENSKGLRKASDDAGGKVMDTFTDEAARLLISEAMDDYAKNNLSPEEFKDKYPAWLELAGDFGFECCLKSANEFCQPVCYYTCAKCGRHCMCTTLPTSSGECNGDFWGGTCCKDKGTWVWPWDDCS